MMGHQIVRTKKKGRPSKADLARRSGNSPATPNSNLRRSRRPRNVRYNIDYDDFLDEDEDDEDDEEEDERGREKKKLKLVEKLNQGEEEEEEEDEPAPPTRGSSRGTHAHEQKEEEVEEEEENGEEEEEEDDEEGNEDEDEGEEEGVEVKGRKVDSKVLHSVSGTPPSKVAFRIPLPDKRTLELILDKLQKKDTYGVYAEPVDPEELPDYHDVIDHPMDFATVRKKLANGSYPTLEQFESDVLLICSNAMQYNAPETIYHKQARSIQELARKKFEKLRIDFERSQSELKSEQKTRPNSLVKKLAKKPLGHASQEPVGSDFSSGATLATIGDAQPISHPIQGIFCERPGNIDGLFEGNAFSIDVNQEKAEDFSSGKGLLSRLGRKSSVQDYERRATYNMSNLPATGSDSIFTTFEGEIKQLVTVGLQAEYSYARSLARFAATLGPTAWRVASQRIQQALSSGCKFGRGWVGEYEPLPTPVLMLHNRVQKQPSLVTKLQSTTELGKDDRNCKNVESITEHPVNGLMFDGKPPSVRPGSGLAPEGKSSLFGSAGVRPNASSVNHLYQQPNFQTRNQSKSENKGLKQVELNSLPSSDHNNASLVAKLTSSTPPSAVSKPREMVPSSKNMNILPSIPFKQPDTNRVVSGELPNGKVRNININRGMTAPSPESTSGQTGRAAPFAAHGQEQTLSDPVQLMRMLAEKAQKQQTPGSSNHSPAETPPVTPSVPSGRREELSNAAAAAARAWMSVGAAGFKQGLDNSSPKNQNSADSLHNSAREHMSRRGETELRQHMSRTRGESELHQHMSQRPDNSSPKNQNSADSLYNSAREHMSRRGETELHQHISRTRGESELHQHMSQRGESELHQHMSRTRGESELHQHMSRTRGESELHQHMSRRGESELHQHMSRTRGESELHQHMSRTRGESELHQHMSRTRGESELHQHMSRTRGESELHQQMTQMPFQPEKNNFPFQALGPQHTPSHTSGVPQILNRPMIFPQAAASDLSRFQMQPPWQGVRPHSQPRQKQETLPPDLNIGFQSPGSPAKQSSGMLVDSQQPDLALQL